MSVVRYGRHANEPSTFQLAYRRYQDARNLYTQIQPYASRAIGTFRNSTFYGTRGGPNLRGTFNKYAMQPSGYRRGSMPRRGTNRLISRKRPGTSRGRRRLRYGTRIRKQALGLFEGKRHVEPLRTTTPAGGVVTRTRLVDDLVGTSIPSMASGSLSSNAFTGRSIFLRGFKIHFLIANTSTTVPVDVRFVFGWRKQPYKNPDVTPGTPDTAVATGDDAFAIFKNKINGAGQQQLGDADHGLAWLNMPYNACKASLDKKVLHVEKDFIVRLGPATDGLEQVFGSNQKNFSIWWDLHNKKWGVKDYTEADANMTSEARENRAYWYPVIYYWQCTPHSSTQSQTVSVSKSWIVYYKNPQG